MKKYQMYNGFNSKLLDDDPIIEAKNGADACRKLLDKIGIKYTKIKRSASNAVKIKAMPITEKDGQLYADGVVSWYEIWDGDGRY